MSDLISYLATRLGLHPEDFSAGGFLAECCAGKEPHHNCVYEGIKLVLGERSKKDLYWLFYSLSLKSFCSGERQSLPLLSMLKKASPEAHQSAKSLSANLKNIESKLEDEGLNLIDLICPKRVEIDNYCSYKNITEPFISLFIRRNLVDHVKEIGGSEGLEDGKPFISHKWSDVKTSKAITNDLVHMPLDERFRKMRLLLTGIEKPGKAETLIRSTIFLDVYRYQKPQDLPEVPVLDNGLLKVFEGPLLKDVIEKILRINDFTPTKKEELLLAEGLKRLHDAGVRTYLGIYNHQEYGFGLGYLEDQAAIPSQTESVRLSLKLMEYGRRSSKSSTSSETDTYTMADVFCNHLLDTMPEAEAFKLLECDAHRLARMRHTGDKTLLGRLENRALVDKQLSTDLGL